MEDREVAENVLFAFVGTLFPLFDVTVPVVDILKLVEKLIIVLQLAHQVVPRLRTEVVEAKLLDCPVLVHPVRAPFALVGLCQIKVEGFVVVKGAHLVHVVQPVGGIVLGEGRDAGPNVGESDRHVRLTRRVEKSVLVSVRVSVVLRQDGLVESVNDAEEVVQPGLGALAIVWRNVSDYVHLIASLFRFMQLFAQPLELIRRIDRVKKRPGIQTSAVVGVDANDAQFFARLHHIVAATEIKKVKGSVLNNAHSRPSPTMNYLLSKGLQCVFRQPIGPFLGDRVV